MVKKCIDCNKLLEVSDFYKSSDRKSGLLEACKQCYKIRVIKRKLFKKKCIKCNNLFKVSKSELNSSRKKFCSKSCNSIFNIESRSSKLRTHSMSNTHFYKKWTDIRYRCGGDFKNYGSRGIVVEWKTFKDFKNSMFKSYNAHVKKYGELNTTIERVDVNGNYSHENCIWATPTVQNRNRRSNKFLEYNGKRKCMSAWAEEYSIPYKAFWWRINSGWDIARALGDV